MDSFEGLVTDVNKDCSQWPKGPPQTKRRAKSTRSKQKGEKAKIRKEIKETRNQQKIGAVNNQKLILQKDQTTDKTLVRLTP